MNDERERGYVHFRLDGPTAKFTFWLLKALGIAKVVDSPLSEREQKALDEIQKLSHPLTDEDPFI